MRTSDFKGMSDKTGVPKEQVNISGSFFFHYSMPAIVPLMAVLCGIQR
jgi:hypothetical protein